MFKQCPLKLLIYLTTYVQYKYVSLPNIYFVCWDVYFEVIQVVVIVICLKFKLKIKGKLVVNSEIVKIQKKKICTSIMWGPTS